MEKDYWGKNFFGSKLNTVLLFVLIVLMVFALRFMYQNKETYLPTENTETPKEVVPTLKEYKNDELGISFSYPTECGVIKVVDEGDNSIYLIPENRDCSLQGIFVTAKTDEGFSECGESEPYEGRGNFFNQYGVEMLMTFDFGNSICSIGPMALMNFTSEQTKKLEKFIPVFSIVGNRYEKGSLGDFIEILKSFQTY